MPLGFISFIVEIIDFNAKFKKVFPFPGFRDATQLPSHLAKRPVHAHRSAQPGTNTIKLFYLVISNPANDVSHLWLYGRIPRPYA
jgi:hypothetical protein